MSIDPVRPCYRHAMRECVRGEYYYHVSAQSGASTYARHPTLPQNTLDLTRHESLTNSGSKYITLRRAKEFKMLKQISLIVLVASIATTAYAKCPNECSGKGVCGENDLCKCYAGYTGLDCSGRLCLFGKAWGDAPFADGYAHDYAECSGQGECDRKTGECKCNDGFTGDGCRYSACPNDCNGHGTCEFITELADGTATAAAGRTHIQYSEFIDQDRTLDGWDSKKARGCKCGPQRLERTTCSDAPEHVPLQC